MAKEQTRLLSPEEKKAKLAEISNSTFNETIEALKKKARVLIVRPTGFGKSYMLSGLTSYKENGELMFKKCLYIYPNKIIRDSVIQDYGPCGVDERRDRLQNTTFISYALLTSIMKTIKRDKKEYSINDRTKMLSGYELYPGIIDISNDGNFLKAPDARKVQYEIRGDVGFRAWIREFDLIMCDEAHRVGSNGFRETWQLIDGIITDSFNGAAKYGKSPVKLIGVTATPFRLDSEDLKSIFANTISQYTLNDCIADGIMNKFDYIYAIGNKGKFIEDTKNYINEQRRSRGLSELFEYEKKEIEDRMNRQKPIYQIIKDNIRPENIGTDNYMKFIIFFNSKKHIAEFGNTVKNWFENAYRGEYKVQEHVIVTKSSDNMDDDDKSNIARENVSGLNYVKSLQEITDLKVQDGVIDLVFCVDMLNMGYHVENITGVMLLRETSSAVIYNQQIGRCFSVRSNNTPIIFDIIDKAQLGVIWDKLSDNKAKGVKNDLPYIIKKENLNVVNEAIGILKYTADLKNQNYEVSKKFKYDMIYFWYMDRQATPEIISQITGFSLADINKTIDQIEGR